MNQIFAVYKPKGWTSHDVVNKVRKITGIKRVGHGGTLDPLAEGVLVIAVGRENTKQLDTFVKGEKEYKAEITLGITSSTDDEEGEKTAMNKEYIPTSKEIDDAIKSFIGKIQQKPPIYSAIKINGTRAYKIARSRENIEMEARIVEIKDIQVDSYDYPTLTITVTTGPGTYIRSLARDIGEKLGTGGYLSSLVRTRVNKFKLSEALPLSQLEKEYVK